MNFNEYVNNKIIELENNIENIINNTRDNKAINNYMQELDLYLRVSNNIQSINTMKNSNELVKELIDKISTMNIDEDMLNNIMKLYNKD